MESVSTFFKEENDILYRLGEMRGSEKARREALEKEKGVVKNLLLANRFTIAEIASYAGVTEYFVIKIQNSLNG